MKFNEWLNAKGYNKRGGKKEACYMLGISERTFYNLKAGKPIGLSTAYLIHLRTNEELSIDDLLQMEVKKKAIGLKKKRTK